MKVLRSALVKLFGALGVPTADGDTIPKLTARVNRNGGIKRLEPDTPLTDKEDAELFAEIVADQAAENLVEIEDDSVAEVEAEVETTEVGGVEQPAEKKPKKKSSEVVPEKKKAVAKKPSTNGKSKKEKAERKPSKKSGVRPKKGEGRKSTIDSINTSKLYDGFPSFSAWVKHMEKNPKPLTDKAAILKTVVEELKVAGKSKPFHPLTQEDLLGIVKDKYPDRDPLKMETNLKNSVPSRLRWMYGIHVWKHREPTKPVAYYIVHDGKEPQPEENGKPKKTSAVKVIKPKKKKVVKKKVKNEKAN